MKFMKNELSNIINTEYFSLENSQIFTKNSWFY